MANLDIVSINVQITDNLNQSVISKNITAFKEQMKGARSASGSTSGGSSGTSTGTIIWKDPTPNKHDRCIIGGNPFLWNAATHHWDQIKNESAGATTAAIAAANLAASNIATAEVAVSVATAADDFPPIVPPVIRGSVANDDAASRTSSVTIEEVDQLQFTLTTITQCLSDIQDQL